MKREKIALSEEKSESVELKHKKPSQDKKEEDIIAKACIGWRDDSCRWWWHTVPKTDLLTKMEILCDLWEALEEKEKKKKRRW